MQSATNSVREDLVVSCSAWKRSFRDRLRKLVGRHLTFVFEQGSRSLLSARLAARTHEYMPGSLLESQFGTLELPLGEPDVITLDGERSVEAIAQLVLGDLETRRKRR